jgi:hypothetical protein
VDVQSKQLVSNQSVKLQKAKNKIKEYFSKLLPIKSSLILSLRTIKRKYFGKIGKKKVVVFEIED